MTSIIATEDSIFGQANDIQDDHLAAMQETEDFKRKKGTNMDMRRRIKQFFIWLQRNYNDEYCVEGGVVALTPKQKKTHQCITTGMILICATAVSMWNIWKPLSGQLKANGKHCSFVHIWKFRDAIKFGAEEAK